ncbi:MAG: DUF4394 domain-containing protein, partial [Chthoniobacterales bacterium]
CKPHPAMKFLILFNRFFAAIAVGALLALPARGTTVYALTDTGSLLTFDHATPTVITNTVTITNLGGYTLLAIDVRPTVQPAHSNPGAGTLWGLGKSGTSFQLFVIDEITGAATAIGAPIAAGISSTPGDGQWGFDFSPVVDRIRLVSSASTNNNYRLDPNTGMLVTADGNLAYDAADVNFGTTPVIDGGAYTTSVFGGSTSLYFLDTNLDILATSSNPNAGTLLTVGALGVNIGEPNGFDIYGSLALFSVPGVGGSSLYSVNLSTGAATLIGAFPALTNVRGLAIAISSPSADVSGPFVQIFGKKKKITHSGNFTLKIRASDESGTVAVFYRVLGQSPSFKLIPQHGKSEIYTAKLRRLTHGSNPVIVRAVDPSGNETIVRVNIRKR